MGTSFQYEQIQLLCQLLFANERVTTLTSHDGMPIYLKYQNLAEIGTLPVVAQTTHQYLQLLDGDIAITNDPYSGGTILSNLYLCIGVSSEQKRNRQVDLLIVKKIALKPKIVLSNNIDEEGLRIPPTPLVVNGQLNKDILMAMSEHPLAPNGFQQAVLKGLDEIKNLHRQFLQFNQIFDMDWSRSFIRDYFKDTQSAMMNFLPRRPAWSPGIRPSGRAGASGREGSRAGSCRAGGSASCKGSLRAQWWRCADRGPAPGCRAAACRGSRS